MSTTTLPIQVPALSPSAAHPGRDSRLDPIVQKVRAGRRISVDDGLLLYETPDLWTVGSLADLVRRRMHGDAAYYNINRHLNYSNVCALSCTFCSFYRKKDQPGAYEYSIDRIRTDAIKAAEIGATEIHIVGGLHPWLEFEYYTDMMRAIREAAPKLHIKAFTAVEIVHLARISKRGQLKDEGIKSVLRDLKEAGLGSLPGGGAEVFDDRVHDEAFKGKIRAGTWLDVHRAAHELGLNSNATILYGHIEERADRIKHMEILRLEQDRTLRSWAQSQGIVLQDDDTVVLTGPDEMYPRKRLPDPDSCEFGYFQTIIPL
ncbi:MAG: radical SAM protein, partial [Phycisphaerales bacterium]